MVLTVTAIAFLAMRNITRGALWPPLMKPPFVSCNVLTMKASPGRTATYRQTPKGAPINDEDDPQFFLDILTPSPLSAFGTDLYYKIHATSSLLRPRFHEPPPLLLMRTSYLESP